MLEKKNVSTNLRLAPRCSWKDGRECRTVADGCPCPAAAAAPRLRLHTGLYRKPVLPEGISAGWSCCSGAWEPRGPACSPSALPLPPPAPPAALTCAWLLRRDPGDDGQPGVPAPGLGEVALLPPPGQQPLGRDLRDLYQGCLFPAGAVGGVTPQRQVLAAPWGQREWESSFKGNSLWRPFRVPGAVLGSFRPKLALLVLLLGRSYLIFTVGETEVRKSCGLMSLQSQWWGQGSLFVRSFE